MALARIGSRLGGAGAAAAGIRSINVRKRNKGIRLLCRFFGKMEKMVSEQVRKRYADKIEAATGIRSRALLRALATVPRDAIT